MDCSQQQHGGGLRKMESPRDILAGPEWSDLACAIDDLKESNSAGPSIECGKEAMWRGASHVLSSVPFSKAPTMQSSGSGDLCLQVGSPASYSSGVSSDRNSSGFMEGLDDLSLSYLMDGNIRAILKKVKVNESVLNRAVQRLGGGEKGLKGLMGYIMMWVKEQKGRELSSPHFMEQLQTPKPAHDLCSSSSYPSAASSPRLAVPCDTSSDQGLDRFHSVGGQVHPASFEAPQGLVDFTHLHRIKSRRLMGEPETGIGSKSQVNGPLSNTLSIGNAGAGFLYPKLEMGTMSTMSSVMPHLKCEDGVQQRVSCLQSGLGYQYANNSEASNKPSPAATTRAARKIRMARQRQSSLQQHARTASHGATTSLGCGPWAVTPSPGGMTNTGRPHFGSQIPSCVPSTGEGQGRNVDSLVFLLQKELRPSDVGNLGRIVLPKKAAETHLPSLAMREGLSIVMEDFDSCISWNLRYRFWPNNKSRMYLLENTGEFVKMHHLEEGDLLILYKNQQGNFVLRGRKKKMHLECTGPQVKVAHSLVKVFPEEPVPKVEDLLTERLYGGGPPDLCGESKTEPDELDDDPFLKDVMQGIGSSFSPECGLLQPLEHFPSLNLDFPIDEFLLVVPKSEPAS